MYVWRSRGKNNFSSGPALKKILNKEFSNLQPRMLSRVKQLFFNMPATKHNLYEVKRPNFNQQYFNKEDITFLVVQFQNIYLR